MKTDLTFTAGFFVLFCFFDRSLFLIFSDWESYLLKKVYMASMIERRNRCL